MAETNLIDFLTKPLIEDGWEKLPTAFMKNGCLLNFKDSLQEIRPSEFLLRAVDVESLKTAEDYNAKLHKMRVNYSSHAKLPNRTYTLEFNRCVVGAGKIPTSITKLPANRAQNAALSKFLTAIDDVALDIDKTYPSKLIPYRSTFEDVTIHKRNPIDDSKSCQEWYYATVGEKIPIAIAYIDKSKNYEKCILTIAYRDGKYIGALERQRTGVSKDLIEISEEELQRLFTIHFFEKSSNLFYITSELSEKRVDNWEFSNKKKDKQNIVLPEGLSKYDLPLHVATMIAPLASKNMNYGPLLEKAYSSGSIKLISALIDLNEDYSIVPLAIDDENAEVYASLAQEVNIKRFLNPTFNSVKINNMFEQFSANVQKQMESFPPHSNEDFKEIRRLASVGVGLKESTQIPDAMRKRAYYFYKTSEFAGLYEPLVNRGEISGESIRCTKATYGEKAFKLARELCLCLPDVEFYGSTLRKVIQYIFNNLTAVSLNKSNELAFSAGVMGLTFQHGYLAILNSYGERIVSAVVLDGELVYEKNKENIDFSFAE